jgi:hypothetical protein
MKRALSIVSYELTLGREAVGRGKELPPGDFLDIVMSFNAKPGPRQDERASARDAPERRQNLVHILFVHRSLADVERCLYELKRARFRVSSDVVVTPEQFAEHLRSQPFDLVVAEYPSTNWQETQVLDLLRQMKKDLPLIFLVHGLKLEDNAELTLKGVAYCIEVENIGHLPIAVRRALDEKQLRDQRDRAEKALRHSEARYLSALSESDPIVFLRSSPPKEQALESNL